MKTTRVWPIPRAGIGGWLDGEPFTVSVYRPSQGLTNWTPIRLCSVDLWIQNLVSHAELSMDIIVGIGNGTTIIRESVLAAESIPVLDEGVGKLKRHQVWYGIREGNAGLNCVYGDVFPNQDFPVQWERPVIGVVRNRRPLRFRWRKDERPYMHLWDERNCPAIWGIPHFSPATTRLEAEMMGMVTFEAEVQRLALT